MHNPGSSLNPWWGTAAGVASPATAAAAAAAARESSRFMHTQGVVGEVIGKEYSPTYAARDPPQSKSDEEVEPGRPFCDDLLKELAYLDFKEVWINRITRFIVPLRPENNPVAGATVLGAIPHPVTVTVGVAAYLANKTILRHHGVVVELSDATFLTLEFNYEGLQWNRFPLPLQPSKDIDDWDDSSALSDARDVHVRPRDLMKLLNEVKDETYSIPFFHFQHFADHLIENI